MTLPDDLTKRLRNTGHVFARSPYHDLLDEAADRIDELEAELHLIADECWGSGGEFWTGTAPMEQLPILSAMIAEAAS